MLLAPDRPTALFAAGYYYALDVYAAALEAGLTIPEDLSLLGVDDPPSAAHLSPPLTTLRQPLVELGRMAARGLFDIIAGEASLPCRTTLRAELIERASVSPPGISVTRNGRLATTNHPIETPAPAAEVIETRGVKTAASPTNGSV